MAYLTRTLGAIAGAIGMAVPPQPGHVGLPLPPQQEQSNPLPHWAQQGGFAAGTPSFAAGTPSFAAATPSFAAASAPAATPAFAAPAATAATPAFAGHMHPVGSPAPSPMMPALGVAAAVPVPQRQEEYLLDDTMEDYDWDEPQPKVSARWDFVRLGPMTRHELTILISFLDADGQGECRPESSGVRTR